MWFCESFGISVTEIQLKDEREKIHKITCPGSGTQDNDPGYEQPTETEKQQLGKILFLLDTFCVSDQAYHELVTESDGLLPKSYPGKYPGAALNFTSRNLINIKPELKGSKSR